MHTKVSPPKTHQLLINNNEKGRAVLLRESHQKIQSGEVPTGRHSAADVAAVLLRESHQKIQSTAIGGVATGRHIAVDVAAIM
mmetsp:Transcript_26891/g.56788  ORF Transcript_26891/g.56788 Transcript_26891/m.56788 type:complete len:83 (-) Transcript_26891:1165-1413(-)